MIKRCLLKFEDASKADDEQLWWLLNGKAHTVSEDETTFAQTKISGPMIPVCHDLIIVEEWKQEMILAPDFCWYRKQVCTAGFKVFDSLIAQERRSCLYLYMCCCSWPENWDGCRINFTMVKKGIAGGLSDDLQPGIAWPDSSKFLERCFQVKFAAPKHVGQSSGRCSPHSYMGNGHALRIWDKVTQRNVSLTTSLSGSSFADLGVADNGSWQQSL